MPIGYRVTGTTIYADDYNRLQSKVAAILGQGGGVFGADYGYGQPVTSSQVVGSGGTPNSGDLVTAEQMNNLRIDIMKCWYHITSDDFVISPVSTTDEIEAGSASKTLGAAINKTYNDYTYAVNYIDTNRRTAHASAMNLVNEKVQKTFSNWNNFRSHDMTVTFKDSNHRRYFFNAGGEIRVTAQHTGTWVASSKSFIWQKLLADSGVVTFDFDDNIDATTAPKSLLYKTPTTSAVYAENYYRVSASAITQNQIFVRAVFHDVDVGDRTGLGGSTDEDVIGTTVNSMGVYFPKQTFTNNGNTYTGVTVDMPTVTSVQGTVY